MHNTQPTFENPENVWNRNGLDKLARSAHDSFQIIEWWKKQKRFDDQPVEALVNRIVKQGPAYYSAIHKSTDTAENSCSFAKDAVAFCERLMLQKDTLPTLIRGLQDIIQVAEQAREGAEDMGKQFRNVRIELFNITKDIPSIAARIKSERAMNTNPQHKYNTKQIDYSQTNGTQRSMANPGQSQLSLRILPESRDDKDVLGEVVSQFERATNDLGELVGHVTSFVDWWTEITGSLRTLQEALPKIQTDGQNPFRTSTVKERWVLLSQKYISYRDRISKIEDYYRNISGQYSPISSHYSPDGTAQKRLSDYRASEVAKLHERGGSREQALGLGDGESVRKRTRVGDVGGEFRDRIAGQGSKGGELKHIEEKGKADNGFENDTVIYPDELNGREGLAEKTRVIGTQYRVDDASESRPRDNRRLEKHKGEDGTRKPHENRPSEQNRKGDLNGEFSDTRKKEGPRRREDTDKESESENQKTDDFRGAKQVKKAEQRQKVEGQAGNRELEAENQPIARQERSSCCIIM